LDDKWSAMKKLIKQKSLDSLMDRSLHDKTLKWVKGGIGITLIEGG